MALHQPSRDFEPIVSATRGRCNSREQGSSQAAQSAGTRHLAHGGAMAQVTPMVVWLVGLFAIVHAIVAGGCGTNGFIPGSLPTLSPEQFNVREAPEDRTPRISVPEAVFTQPEVVDESREIEGPATDIVESRELARTTLPDGQPAAIPLGPEKIASELPPGRPWPVDGLVGQINGKAIYADDFLEPMADRLARVGANTDRAQARREIVAMVTERFEQEVNNRLIISEAESRIPPEAREGLFQWLRTLQEQEVAERGGTRSAAEASLQDQFGMSVEQFMERRKNEALAADLINRRLRPRAIVSWRDIERAYERNFDKYNPGPTLRVGRIIVPTQGNTNRIAEIQSQLAAGADFTTIARELRMRDDGFWFERQLGEGGIEGMTDLLPEVRKALAELSPGQTSPPLVLGPATMWISLLGREQAPSRSLFDPEVQISIRNELEQTRLWQEQERYFDSLRNRWITESIDDMRMRLIEIALRRYFLP
ncbi:MAG: peptidylprolyl isomerase [Phycisphaeraceae bacterium]|nr:peptidylprolyl isomerase [Phycisphaeraceae bacterium]